MNIFLCWNATVFLVIGYLHETKGKQPLRITVVTKIKYGETLKLTCRIEGCCSSRVGWKVDGRILFEDVRHLSPFGSLPYYPTFRVCWEALHGVTLVIPNFSEGDLGKTHLCSYNGDETNMTLIGDDVLLECPQGRFGQNCQFKCNCLDGNSCNRVDGSCPNGQCARGWQLKNCFKECDHGRFGQDCQFKCNCLNGADCDHVNGSCPHGRCAAGWQLNTCSKECDHGRFGQTCQFKCNCLNEAYCDHVDGSCPNGHCAAGWQLNNCSKACNRGTYGIGCNKTCSKCIGETCDQFNGTCSKITACKPGYLGLKCDQTCPKGTYGHACVENCGGCIDEMCEVELGNCTKYGCKQGFTGHKCNMQATRGESVSTTFDEKEKATEKTFLDMSTDSNSHGDFNETTKEKGQSFRENLYYGLLAVGLVLILCFSILFNLCINKKCKTAVIQTTENQQENALNVQANHMAHLGRFDNDAEEYISHYETINESEMVPKRVFAVITNDTNKPKHRSSASYKVYLEKIEDDLKHKRSETLVDPKDAILRESNLDSNTDTVPPSEVDELLDGDRSSSDSDDITCSNTDDYLHSYTTLNANDMECLNSYSSVTHVYQAIIAAPLKLPDSDSSFCLKK